MRAGPSWPHLGESCSSCGGPVDLRGLVVDLSCPCSATRGRARSYWQGPAVVTEGRAMTTMAPLRLGYAFRHCPDCPSPEGGETPIGAWILGAVAADKGEGRDTCPFTGPMGEEWLSGWRSWRAHQRRAAR